MKKSLTIVLTLVLLSACGFEPLYVQRKQNNTWYFGGDFDTSITSEMSQIKVEAVGNRFGQMVRNQLLDSLTPRGVPRKPKYRLYADPEERQIVQQALRDDITATRERVQYMVSYVLYEGDEVIISGNSVAFVSYDILSNPYSTTMAQKKTEKDAAKIIADDISLRIGAYFHSRITKKGSLSDFKASTDR